MFASYKRNGASKAAQPSPPLPSAPPLRRVRCLRQRRINDCAGPRQHAIGTRSRLIARIERKATDREWSRIQARLSLRVSLIYWLILDMFHGWESDEGPMMLHDVSLVFFF